MRDKNSLKQKQTAQCHLPHQQLTSGQHLGAPLLSLWSLEPCSSGLQMLGTAEATGQGDEPASPPRPILVWLFLEEHVTLYLLISQKV